ncbi:penicillin acylase family protein [Sphingosinicella rhizophila]|uniref:Penicillin acylase family protein n=1 Tax=Sphingosinicella rhizophila TaxID=3050082 RepID=A0ABU3Q3Z8_9SPHN|nr:penicillin acylase family protein [Sphingosinicella sp. GR2756]MDT9598148.1 penicillin acylase family protein [Sphingosinicella sp. GR2756]
MSAPAAAAEREAWDVEGLEHEAELIVDRWGLAHIYAASERDAYFLQGYNVARDRLWQVDLWRKRGLGLLSASLGPAYVKKDRAARLLLYRGDMQAEWDRYGPGSLARYEAFAAGINAFVDEVLAGRKPLPEAFVLTDSRPARWRAEDIVRIRSNTLVGNVRSEVARAQVACAAGIDADRLRLRLYPDHKTEIPAGLDPCDIVPEVLQDYGLATADVSFEPGRETALADPNPADAAEAARMEGSNNWVIAPSKSATGRPILANDPHRVFAIPSLRYVVHLEAPGLSLIGAGEPAVPGISLGHNGKGAFGLTIFGTDQEDLYVYELKPGEPDSYRYGDGWERMKIVRETIAVKGGKAEQVELRFTRHGPVLFQDAAKGRAFALRTIWSTPGTSGYAAASWHAQADSWDDFRRTADHWGTPPLNLIWADTSGTTGWIASAMVPVRHNWDGLLPVPGDGRYEWDGVLREGALPSIKNPAKGWFASANEMNLPPNYPASPPISYEASDRSRADRLGQVLGARDKVSIADAAALQMDTYSNMAARLVKLSRGMAPADADQRKALALLGAWDLDVGVDSIAASIYETWATQHLGRTLIARAAPAAARIIGAGSADASLHALETRDPLLGADPDAAIQAILSESLAATLEDLRTRLGSDMDGWRWGKLHGISLEPAIAVLADAERKAAMAVGPAEMPGSASTPALMAYRGTNFAAVHGASVRLVIDVGAWDKSLFLNMPGQSGNADDPHYKDLFGRWRAGDFAPLSYTRAAVDAAAERVIRLRPAR